MSREIRITIDDDEVFERMKTRKRALDLSWEEVLHRGLRRDPPSSDPQDAPPTADPTRQRGQPGTYGTRGEPADQGWAPGARSGQHGGQGEGDRWDQMADSIESEIQSKVYDTIRRSFGAAGIEVPEDPGLDREMETLQAAEDAVLEFEMLDEDVSNRVPLRVNLRTSAEGLVIEVVAVRTGKSVTGYNTFTGKARAHITEGLATGGTATLSMGDGAESYRVVPVLDWGRNDQGEPTVTDVEIREVVFGDE